jgi:hypothetical protein
LAEYVEERSLRLCGSVEMSSPESHPVALSSEAEHSAEKALSREVRAGEPEET